MIGECVVIRKKSTLSDFLLDLFDHCLLHCFVVLLLLLRLLGWSLLLITSLHLLNRLNQLGQLQLILLRHSPLPRVHLMILSIRILNWLFLGYHWLRFFLYWLYLLRLLRIEFTCLIVLYDLFLLIHSCLILLWVIIDDFLHRLSIDFILTGVGVLHPEEVVILVALE